MAHTHTDLLYHFVFSTKHRQPWITPALQDHLHPYLGGIVREMRGRALNVNGMPDHVHLLAPMPAAVSVAEVMRVLKANSSKWIHTSDVGTREFAWQAGYGAFTVSRANAHGVERYIAGQQAHHLRGTFQEEYVSLLKTHGVEYKERYLWD